MKKLEFNLLKLQNYNFRFGTGKILFIFLKTETERTRKGKLHLDRKPKVRTCTKKRGLENHNRVPIYIV